MDLRCGKCGTLNPPERDRCRICGELFPSAKRPSSGFVRCPHCQAENPEGARECSVCQRGLALRKPVPNRQPAAISNSEWDPKTGYEDVPHQARRVAWVGLGGVLILLAGAFGIADAVVSFGILSEYELLNTETLTCGIMMALFGAVAVMGGIMAIMRLNFPLAVIGGVCGIFAYGCVLGSILSIIGLVIIAVKHKAFSQ